MTAETRLVALLGDPVSHSLSPRMQNAAFAARGLDWAYVALPVPSGRLRDAVRGLAALGFAGANVTIPHKEAVARLCDELDGFAERAASVNTLVVRDGRITGSSTDGVAVTDAIEASGTSALLLGAGGAARAVASALLEAGAAALTVAARSTGRAEELVARLRTSYPAARVAAAETWPSDPAGISLLVNATPIRDETLVRPEREMQVVDLAYRTDGQPTALVAAARTAGCERVVDGLEVLVRQGAASFERWTGVGAPVDVMQAAVRAG
ncbi:MAG: shikimate dehydrogenase [Actinobacteria bacterium]|nr:shikimate dehydrogenase [Actinomycetota bacterium]